MSLSDRQYILRTKANCVVDANGCWLWQGFIHESGYGARNYRGRNIRVHRMMYMLCVGPIPKGLDVCHTCDVRHCVNPAHLWVGTRKDNMADCVEKGRHDSMKRTHCKHGHELTPENTYYSPSYEYRPRPARKCKRCSMIRQRMRAGWTREQAESLPPTPHGHRPVNGNFHRSEP